MDGISEDSDVNGIPDECVDWISNVGQWSNASLWDTGIVPNNTGTNAWSVTLDAAGDQVDVDLDIPVEIDTLRLLSGAQLDFTTGDLTIANSNGIRNDGLMLVNDARSLIVGKAFLLTGTGELQLDGADASLGASSNGMVVTNRSNIVGFGVIETLISNDGTIRANVLGEALVLAAPAAIENDGVIEALNGGIVRFDTPVVGSGLLRAVGGCNRADRGCTPPLLVISAGISAVAGGLNLSDAGTLEFATGSSSVQVAGLAQVVGGTLQGAAGSGGSLQATDAVLASSFMGPGRILLSGSMSFVASANVSVDPCSGREARGCTPPLLSVQDAALMEIGGDFSIKTDIEITVESFTPVVLYGDFVNESANPFTFDWLAGGLELAGSQPQSFEVAGADLGASTIGFVDNFALGDIEIAATADVIFVNSNGNGNRAGGCGEALYVDTLLLRAGATLTLDNVRVYCAHLQDEGAAVIPIGCGELVVFATGDYDDNGIIDLNDFVEFEACISGPGEPYTAPACGAFDFNGDEYLDLADFAALMALIAE